jgi:ABC-type branched-subunit amino acid transport system substrate-binding protein
LISSETGDFGAVGKAFSDGVRFAYEEYKVAHPDTKIELYGEDDGSEGKKALSAYNKLTSLNHIDALINFSSPSLNINYNAVTKSGIPVIQLGEQDIAPTADTVFQVYPTQDIPEVATGEYVKSVSNGNDTVLFYTNDSTVMKFVANIKKGYGKDFVEEFKLDQNQKEYATIVAKAMSHNPKFAVISAYSQNGGRVLLELMKYKNKPTIIFDLTYDGAEYKGVLPNLSILNGSHAMTLAQNMDKGFAEKYKTQTGKDPIIFTAYGYDAFNTLVSGKSDNKSTWNKNLSTTKISGATGNISFDEKGLRAPEFMVKTLQDGVLVGE